MIEPHIDSLPILIVEDDDTTLTYLTLLLQTAGYQVIEAHNGADGWNYAEASLLRAILLDRRLPDADGIVLCRKLRDLVGAHVPIIVMTADAEVSLQATAEEAGATQLLRKPFLPQALLAALAAML